MMKILIIGTGNMGYTYAKSFLDSHIVRPSDLMLMNRSANKMEQIAKELSIQKYDTQAADFICDADLVILSVKPQDSIPLFASIKPFVHAKQLILSVMAGVKIKTIQEYLGIEKVFRAMPNLPSQIGLGMTAFTSASVVEKSELLAIQNLLSTTGRVMYFENENSIDASTAVSGSGPAYVFLLMDSMMQAAQEIGFSETEAELLVWQTFHGAIHLQHKSNLSCENWINRVASKGGTTEAAFRIFNNYKLKEAFTEGIKAAFQRAKELGN